MERNGVSTLLLLAVLSVQRNGKVATIDLCKEPTNNVLSVTAGVSLPTRHIAWKIEKDCNGNEAAMIFYLRETKLEHSVGNCGAHLRISALFQNHNLCLFKEGSCFVIQPTYSFCPNVNAEAKKCTNVVWSYNVTMFPMDVGYYRKSNGSTFKLEYSLISCNPPQPTASPFATTTAQTVQSKRNSGSAQTVIAPNSECQGIQINSDEKIIAIIVLGILLLIVTVTLIVVCVRKRGNGESGKASNTTGTRRPSFQPSNGTVEIYSIAHESTQQKAPSGDSNMHFGDVTNPLYETR